MSIEIIKVPDVGDYDSVDVIEVAVAVGDIVAEEDALITVETDKASMEIPAPCSGKIVKITVNVGDKVSEGSVIMEVETVSSEAAVVEEAPLVEAKSDAIETVVDVLVPDVGDYDSVDVIEVSVAVGDVVEDFSVALL